MLVLVMLVCICIWPCRCISGGRSWSALATAANEVTAIRNICVYQTPTLKIKKIKQTDSYSLQITADTPTCKYMACGILMNSVKNAVVCLTARIYTCVGCCCGSSRYLAYPTISLICICILRTICRIFFLFCGQSRGGMQINGIEGGEKVFGSIYLFINYLETRIEQIS